MFSVVGDRGARVTRYAINHSVEERGRQGHGARGWGGVVCKGGVWGAVTVWQGDVSRATSLWRSPPPFNLPRYHTISPSVASALFFSVTFFYLTSHIFIPSIKALCLPPGVYLLGPTVTHALWVLGPTYHMVIGYIEFTGCEFINVGV